MKKAEKIISIVMLVAMILMMVTTVVSAEPVNPNTLTGKTVTGTDKIEDLGNQIITVVSTVGSIASVIVLVVLGIKYMMGSAEEKSEYKKTLLPYVIGAALVFAASSIAGLIFGFTQNLAK